MLKKSKKKFLGRRFSFSFRQVREVLDSILMEAAVTKFGAEVINHPKEVDEEIGKHSYW